MPWWAWVAVFSIILVGGGWWLWQRVRVTWRSVRALNAQLAQTSEVVGSFEAAASRIDPEPGVAAVFTLPYDAHREHTRIRASVDIERRKRREANRPPWARR